MVSKVQKWRQTLPRPGSFRHLALDHFHFPGEKFTWCFRHLRSWLLGIKLFRVDQGVRGRQPLPLSLLPPGLGEPHAPGLGSLPLWGCWLSEYSGAAPQEEV